jgi:diaminopimelate decarboxylase
MNYVDTPYFHYDEISLKCEDQFLAEIAEEYGTPVFVYSKKFFQDRYREFSEAFSSIEHKIFFATKSNFNLNVMKIFYDLGSGIDVNSAGEFYRAFKIGVDPKRMLFTGVGKTEEEIKLALEHDVLVIKAESIQEIERINEIAKLMNKMAPLAIRVNPDVDPLTHPYISTGMAENKFGIDAAKAFDIFVKSASLSNIDLHGIDMHIGSQITSVEPYVESVLKLTELIKKLKSAGIDIKHYDLGGGMGITYNDEDPFTPKELAEKIVPILKQVDCEIFFEPGRFLTGNGGVLLTKVLYTKSNQKKNFIVVDAAMTDLIRPSIYKAYHHIQPITKSPSKDITADIVGPVCESGDFLAKSRNIIDCKRNEILAVLSTGAYAMVMSSNYNARPRSPEILVDGKKHYLIRSRETYEHLLYDEKIINELH